MMNKKYQKLSKMESHTALQARSPRAEELGLSPAEALDERNRAGAGGKADPAGRGPAAEQRSAPGEEWRTAGRAAKGSPRPPPSLA